MLVEIGPSMSIYLKCSGIDGKEKLSVWNICFAVSMFSAHPRHNKIFFLIF